MLYPLLPVECGLKLDDEAVTVAVGLIGSRWICAFHMSVIVVALYRVDAYGVQSWSTALSVRDLLWENHQTPRNDLIARRPTFSSVGVPVIKEPWARSDKTASAQMVLLYI